MIRLRKPPEERPDSADGVPAALCNPDAPEWQTVKATAGYLAELGVRLSRSVPPYGPAYRCAEAGKAWALAQGIRKTYAGGHPSPDLERMRDLGIYGGARHHREMKERLAYVAREYGPPGQLK